MRRNAKQIALGLALTATCFSGCSTLSTKTEPGKKNIWSPKTWFEEEYQNPVSVAVIWSPDTLTVSGQPPMRGFGGRVFFYNEKSQTIPVQGDLVVHGFEKAGDVAKGDPAADKTFRFSKEELTGHFSPSELGASYSIWVPWDAAGGTRKELSLVATFKSAEGKVVQGAPAKLMLPGKAPTAESGELPRPKSAMQQVSYRRETTSALDNSRMRNSSGVRTTTIAVPRESSLTRKRATSFTLGGTTGNEQQTVSTGAGNETAPSSVIVGGQGVATPGPSAPAASLSTGQQVNKSTARTLGTVRGLPAPPTRIEKPRIRPGVVPTTGAVPHRAGGN